MIYQIRIDALFNMQKGTLQSSKCTPGEFKFLTASAEWKTHNEYSHECEALVFAAAASGSLGRTHYVDGKFISSDLCIILTPRDEEHYPIDLEFYHIIFNEYRSDIVKNTKAGTSKEAIGLGALGRYKLPYYGLERQKSIKSRYLDLKTQCNELDTELSLQIRIIEKLRQTWLKEAMQGKLVPQDPDDEPASELLKRIKAEKAQLIKENKLKPGKVLAPITPDDKLYAIPDNWVWCRLGDITASMTNGIYKKDKYYNDSGIGCFRMYNISEGKINFVKLKRMQLSESELRTYLLEENDLLVNRVNSIELLGKTALIPELDEPHIFESKNIRLRLCCKELTGAFINYLFLTQHIKIQILSTYKKVTGQASISQDNLAALVIPFPPEQEMNRIVQRIDNFMQLCDEMKTNIEHSLYLNDKLLKATLREAIAL